MIQWLKRLFAKPAPLVMEPKRGGITTMALDKASRKASVQQVFHPYEPPAGVIPANKRSEALAMDATPYDYVNAAYVNNNFPGYQYLAMLAQLPEYRKMSEVVAKEMTRKWIKLSSKSKDDDKSDKIAKIEDALKKFKVQALFRKAAELDGLYGRGQIYIDVDKPSGGLASEDPDELATPLFIAPAKIKKGALKGFLMIEPVWTYPSAYNATDPLSSNYYRPQAWYVMGRTVHASRLLNFVGREVPDLLKSAYNFGGLSMSQMAQPYVQNFIRTRDSVSDVVHSFSVSGVMTNMSSVLSGTDDAQFFNRAQLFNTLRDNRGLMMLDKDSEEFFQFNTPLSGLDSLQAQSQEQMSAVSSIPLVKLLGITPSGLNASSDGEIQVFYDHIGSMQAALFSDPLTKVIQLIQLNEFGEIDPDIVFQFETLYGMDDVEKSTVRKANADTDAVLVSIGAISPDEARARVASDPESGYDSLEGELDDEDNMALQDRADSLTAKAKVNDDHALDAEFNESDHPRAENGQFGSGAGKKKEYTDRNGFVRQGGLSKAERKHESALYGAIKQNPHAVIEKYRAMHGLTIDPDKVKDLSAAYRKDKDLAKAVHEPSSAASKLILTQYLAEKAAAGDESPTIFTAGGSGSGKSATQPIAERKLGAKSGGLVIDSVLSNFKSAESRIDETLAATKGDVGIAYTNTPLESALKFNAKRTRAVSIDTLIHAHVGASNNIRVLQQHYADNPRVKIVVMNNLGKIEDAHEGSVSDVPQYDKSAMREKLVSVAKSLLDNGEIDAKRYLLLVD